jgi:hypothetical protein
MILVPLCLLQIGLAAALSNAIVYEVVQHYVNFISIFCVAFATGALTFVSIWPILTHAAVWYSSTTYRHDLRDDHNGRAPSPLRFQHSTGFNSRFFSHDSRWNGSSSSAVFIAKGPHYRTTLPEKSASLRPSQERMATA